MGRATIPLVFNGPVKYLLFGANGQLGWQLRRSLSRMGTVIPMTRADVGGDLLDPIRLQKAVVAVQPHVVVNAAAYTAVDAAETDSVTALAVNGHAPAALAAITADLGIWLLHFSTDYVFEGSGETPWGESDEPHPLNWYGRSKLFGDLAVANLNTRHLIFRTSWMYDSCGNNFVTAIIRQLAIAKAVPVVCDQWGAPTRARHVADAASTALAQVLARSDGDLAGLYNVAASGCVNWHGYAALIAEQLDDSGLAGVGCSSRLLPVMSADYPRVAPRPRNSRLNTDKLASVFGIRLPPWEEGVHAVVDELVAQPKFWRTLNNVH